MSKTIQVVINGATKSVVVPDDATDDEIDSIVNEEAGSVAQPPAAKPEKQGYLESIAQPSIEYGQRLQERAERVNRQTNTEKLIPGDNPLEQVAAIPERAVRMAGGAIESLGEVIPSTLSTVDRVFGKVPSRAIKGGLGFFYTDKDREADSKYIAPYVAKAVKAYQGLPQEVKDTAASVASIAAALPIAKIAQKGLGALKKNPVVGAVAKYTDDAVDAAEGSLRKSLKSQAGSVAIPDIDDADELAEMGLRTSKEIRKNAPKAPKTPMLSGIDDAEAIALADAKPEGVTHFTDYADMAIKAKRQQYKGVASPLDIASRKGKTALTKVSDLKSDIGNSLSTFIDDVDEYSTATSYFVDTRGIKGELVGEIENKLGARLVDGKMVAAAGREIADVGAEPLIKRVNQIIGNLPDEATIKQVNDARRAISNEIRRNQASRVKQIFTPDETIGLSMERKLQESVDGWVEQYLSPEELAKYKDIRKNYANIVKIEDRLNRKLGEVIDQSTGETSMGASLLKAAINSNSRGVRPLFAAVKELTGIDLLTEAAYADIAMKAVGDYRAYDLLQKSGEMVSIGGSIARGDVLGAGGKIAGKVLGGKDENKIYKLIDFYNKNQLKQSRNPGADAINKNKDGGLLGGLKKTLGNERGGIGGDALKGTRFEKLTPAIKSPESGKIYKGWAHKNIFKEQITRQEPGAERAVWQAIFDDNTGKGSPLIGFVDKNGEFISRIDAEKEIDKLTEVGAFSMYGSTPIPMLGLTAAGAGGALTAAGVLSGRKAEQDEPPAGKSAISSEFDTSRAFNNLLKSLTKKELEEYAKYENEAAKKANKR